MTKNEKDGDYIGARDENNNVMFSLKTLRLYKPNWLKRMTKNDMNMCACATCQDADDLLSSYNAKRKKIVAKAEVRIDQMERELKNQTTRETRSRRGEIETREKEMKALKADLQEYKSEIF